MEVIIVNSAGKYLDKLDAKTKNRITNGLYKLSKNPPVGDIVSLKGRDGFRLRIGDYRILFEIISNKIIVYDIGLRGDIYK